MADLSHFPITHRWPARHPERLQLYSLPTPNGVKVAILLEELGLPYEVHRIDFGQNDQHTAEFLSLSPNNKIPALLDPDGPGGEPLGLFESGAILLYLAEKTGRLLPEDPARRYQAIQWLMFQMGGIGPMFGQLGFFTKFAGREIEDPRPRERYVAEARRLLGVLDGQLKGRAWGWARTTASSTSPPSPGSAPCWRSMEWPIWSASRISPKSGASWRSFSPVRRCNAACRFRQHPDAC